KFFSLSLIPCSRYSGRYPKCRDSAFSGCFGRQNSSLTKYLSCHGSDGSRTDSLFWSTAVLPSTADYSNRCPRIADDVALRVPYRLKVSALIGTGHAANSSGSFTHRAEHRTAVMTRTLPLAKGHEGRAELTTQLSLALRRPMDCFGSSVIIDAV